MQIWQKKVQKNMDDPGYPAQNLQMRKTLNYVWIKKPFHSIAVNSPVFKVDSKLKTLPSKILIQRFQELQVLLFGIQSLPKPLDEPGILHTAQLCN